MYKCFFKRILDFIAALESAQVFESPIVTAVEPASKFWEAEAYHHDYFNQNPQNQFCQVVIAPKLSKYLKSLNH